jgi:putative membrane protein
MLSWGPVAASPAGLATVGFVLGGVVLGTASGLTPGLHANNFALALAAGAAGLPGTPTQVAAAVLAAGVTHTFLDVVPALTLGVPDASMAASALPAHRLVLAGRGHEALRLSALGSGLAVLVALPLSVPVTAVMTALYPALRAWLPAVLAAVVAALLATEPTVRRVLAGAVAVTLSGLLGVATLDLSPAAPLSVGGTLTPLFAGLFGAPVLVDALDGAGVPPQDDPAVATSPAATAPPALAGTVAGAMVGYLPGVSAGVASVLALAGLPGGTDARGYLVATSGANTANTVFALFALVSLRTPRTGVMVAVERVTPAPSLPSLLAAGVVAAGVGFVLVVVAGDRYLETVGQIDPTALSLAVLGLLVLLSWAVTGLVGVGIFAVATLVGLVPPRLGTRRVHLMGVLLGPLILSGVA